MFRLGDPINAATPEYVNNGSESGASFASRAGDHHDGMHFFGMTAAGAYDRNALRPRPAGDEPREHHAGVPARQRPDAGEQRAHGARRGAEGR
jgi:hypothetical protein